MAEAPDDSGEIASLARTIDCIEEVTTYMSLQSIERTSRSQPASLSDSVQAGPLSLSIVDVVFGAPATEQVLAVSSHNLPPVDGVDYVLVRMSVENQGTAPIPVGGDDFGFTGSSGVVRRALGLFPPNPQLEALVQPGESVEGWVVGAADANDQNLLLIFDSRFLSGDWSDAVFALRESSSVADVSSPTVAPNETGSSTSSPAGINDQVATDEWAVEIVRAAFAQEVFNLFPASDYRTTALGMAAPDLVSRWVALLVQVTNNQVGGRIGHFPATAFQLVYADGRPVNDVRVLTPPNPDSSGDYYPGASRQGWVAFELPVGFNGSLLRFLPYSNEADARFLTWSDGSAPASGIAEPTPSPPDTELAAGTTVTITEEEVNLRAEPSVGGEIVAVLQQGAELIVTGEGTEADGYLWYPVSNEATGDSGFVAANFIRES
jgi:hypothetical protein